DAPALPRHPADRQTSLYSANSRCRSSKRRPQETPAGKIPSPSTKVRRGLLLFSAIAPTRLHFSRRASAFASFGNVSARVTVVTNNFHTAKAERVRNFRIFCSWGIAAAPRITGPKRRNASRPPLQWRFGRVRVICSNSRDGGVGWRNYSSKKQIGLTGKVA